MGGQIRRLALHNELIEPILLGDSNTISGLPDDTSIRMDQSYYDESRQTLFLIVQSDEFEDVPEGEIIPEVTTPLDKYESYEVKAEDPR